jgi:drug/metabolite transporter (DMT)-like permease
MQRLWSSPILLLLTVGGLLGASLPLGKLAGDAGVAPILWAIVISTGVTLLLGALLAARGELRAPDAHHLRYFAGTAAVSYAIPNLLLFSVIPKVGAGYAGIMFTLSPIITLLFSVILGVRRPSGLGMAGIGIGFAGALLVALSRGGLDTPAPLIWVLTALLIPVSLACGNIYRTWDWPKGAGPIELAVGSHAVAALALFGLALVLGSRGGLGTLASVPALTIAQMLAAAGMFAVFFRLQAVGGPVYLSQIGYVAAAVGLLAGTFAFGEHYPLPTWVGVVFIAAGVTLTTRAQRRL